VDRQRDVLVKREQIEARGIDRRQRAQHLISWSLVGGDWDQPRPMQRVVMGSR
jgi:hypothetical protein